MASSLDMAVVPCWIAVAGLIVYGMFDDVTGGNFTALPIKENWFAWHSVLMIVAFPCLMPLGRYANATESLDKSSRRSMHRLLTILGALVALFVYFCIYKAHEKSKTFFGYYFVNGVWTTPERVAHDWIGYTVLSLLLLQAPMGIVKRSRTSVWSDDFYDKPVVQLQRGRRRFAATRHYRYAIVVGLIRRNIAVVGAAKAKSGMKACPCLDQIAILSNLTVNTDSNQNSRVSLNGKQRDPVDDCLIAQDVDHLLRPGERYCYPVDYGRGRCAAWDFSLLPECADWSGGGHRDQIMDNTPEYCKGSLSARIKGECVELFQPKKMALPWCPEEWCYVDKDNCDQPVAPSYYFPGQDVWYSYDTCGCGNFFEVWNAPQIDMCKRFQVVEKPFLIMWLSCWACAFIQQIFDATRLMEEDQDRLSRGQRGYLAFQLVVLVIETFANVRRIPWHRSTWWSNYNLYVYVFINSSVFVRATMMSMITYDWFKSKLLKFSVLPYHLDGKGWTEEGRAAMLVSIFQFLSSMGAFAVITITHIIPAFFAYYWIFLLVAAGLVKSRSWVAMVGLDPEGRFGRALVMGTNSFISCTGIQFLVTGMVRVYAGEWKAGYLAPLRNDFLSRRLTVWYACHLGDGVSVNLVWDQDFINLFVR